MDYQTLYRAWRPQQFADMVGQSHVRTTLRNALLQDKVAHAYLFCGPRGTGKTSTAKILAKAVNCLHSVEGEPCNACQACLSIAEGAAVDVEEIDAASNRGVDEIRSLRDKVHYAPAYLKRKVYIVDEVHMLTMEAFNALLKTLEEPPSYVLFILATTEPHKIPATIVSRCQRFDFRRIEPADMVGRLRAAVDAERWQAADEALWQIAEAADGGMRDALGLLEQAAAYGEGQITLDVLSFVMGGLRPQDKLSLLESLVQGDLLAVLQKLSNFYQTGKDAGRIAAEMLAMFRDVLVVRLSPADRPLLHSFKDYKEIASRLSSEWLLLAMSKMNDTMMALRHAEQPRLMLETALLSLSQVSSPGDSTTMAVMEAQPTVSRLIAATRVADAGIEKRQMTPLVRSPDEKSSASESSAQKELATPSPSGQNRQLRAPAAMQGRKREVLLSLFERQDGTALQAICDRWQDILQSVRQQRIQAHAWLMNGQPVLATEKEMVIAFGSKIHRDAVMKPDERNAIEWAVEHTIGEARSLLAILQSDWEEFLAEQDGNAVAPESWLEVVESLFGKDKIEYVTDEL
ncbi:DNA polymerase III subunit gamma/tau [Alicyclobacillus tolerans]|uniref:DNA polymerase III subunit gamma/tau n=1 Tax=Alicyclobacillus tolerans TaxID=90970 RepID=UPI003B78E989